MYTMMHGWNIVEVIVVTYRYGLGIARYWLIDRVVEFVVRRRSTLFGLLVYMKAHTCV